MSHPSRRLLMVLAGPVCGLGVGFSALAEDRPSATPPEADAAKAAPADEPKKYTLEFKFRPGEVVRYEVTDKSELTTIKGEVRQTVKNTSRTRRSFTVKQRSPAGEGDLEMLIEWVHMVAEFIGDGKERKVEFQSDDPDKQPTQFQAVLDTVGRRQAQIRFNPMGQPLAVKAVDPAQPPNPNAGAAPGTDASPESYLMILPPAPIAIGEGWFERYDILAREDKLAVRIAMRRTYTLAEVKDGVATINFSTRVLTPVENPQIKAQLIERETAGKIGFDLERGLIVSRDVVLDQQVIDPLGQGSSMVARRTYRERLLSAGTTANRPTPATDVSR